jgi:hypothetical protein
MIRSETGGVMMSRVPPTIRATATLGFIRSSLHEADAEIIGFCVHTNTATTAKNISDYHLVLVFHQGVR